MRSCEANRMPDVASVAESCPHGCGQTVRTVAMDMTPISSRCSDCGWDSAHNPRIYTSEEARQEVVDAARAVAAVIHRSNEVFACDAMLRSRAQQLREQADAIERRDAVIRRLQHSLARLEAVDADA